MHSTVAVRLGGPVPSCKKGCITPPGFTFFLFTIPRHKVLSCRVLPVTLVFRYNDDGAMSKKMPVSAAQEGPSECSSDSPSEEVNENGHASSRRRKRPRRLLRKCPGAGLPDPVLSTLSVNKDLG